MAQYTEGAHKGFVANAAITKYARVKLTSNLTPGQIQINEVTTAGLTDDALWVASRAALAALDRIDVVRARSLFSYPYIANGAITLGAAVYTAANGKVSATNATGSNKVGYAAQAATNDGDVIEVLGI